MCELVKCKECQSTIINQDYKGFCDIKCHGRYYGKKSSLVDYGEGTCKNCNKNFIKKSINQLYCAKDCRPVIKKEKICSGCNINKADYHKKYCAECKLKKENERKYVKNKSRTNECARCGKNFTAKNKSKKYCSETCKYTKKECLLCGKVFMAINADRKYCSNRCVTESSKKSNEEFMEEFFRIHKNNIVPLELYKGSDYFLKTKCLHCGKEMSKRSRFYIGSYKTGCQFCGNKSKGEAIIEEYLKNNKYSYRRQFPIENEKGNCSLRYDFMAEIKGVNILIEYDGEDHFEVIGRSKDMDINKRKFEERKQNDRQKDKYSKDNNILLIRIPYWEFNNIGYILDKMIEYIECKDKNIFNDLSNYLVNHPKWSHENYKCQVKEVI